MLAVGAAVVAFRSDQRSRDMMEDRRRSEQETAAAKAQLDAAEVRVTARVSSYIDTLITGLRFQVENGTAEALAAKVTLDHEDFHQLINQHSIVAGEVVGKTVQFGAGTPFSVAPDIAEDELEEWLESHLDKVQLEFYMNGSRWMRQGSGPVQRL